MLSLVTEFISGSLPSLALRFPRVGGAAREIARPRVRRHWSRSPDVIQEALFADVLHREKKRSDRFDQPFVLAVVAIDGRPDPTAPVFWSPVIDAVIAAKRETDVLGWLDEGSALGVMLPDVAGCGTTAIRAFESRLQRELASRMDPDSIQAFSIACHVSDPNHTRAKAAGTIAPTLTAARPGQRLRDLGKRCVDVVGSVVFMILLAPFFLLAAAMVKATSRGPVLFRQSRIGAGGTPFTMLKFRTMEAGADSAIHEAYVRQFIEASAASPGATPAAPFKMVTDPRVTPVGRILRKTSLDELPQFWNVLRGEMSLVGPRPPLPYEVKHYKHWQRRRILEAKPGITGLWQVTGRSSTTLDEMARLDLRYVRTSSAWADLKIMLATPRAVISGKGAS
jgi:lipopolysaccharide/colanic/teichoic acid biosynthesis glycosyltransferase